MVIPMTNVPQNVTRIAPGACVLASACRQGPPKTAKASSELTETGMMSHAPHVRTVTKRHRRPQ